MSRLFCIRMLLWLGGIILGGKSTGFGQTPYSSYCYNCFPAVPGQVYQSAFGDCDGDGDLDIVVSGLGSYGSNSSFYQESYTQLYLNNGAGTYSLSNASFVGLNNGEVAWGDYNGDGKPDLAMMGVYDDFSSSTNSHAVYTKIYPNTGNGTFGTPFEFTGLVYGGLDWGDADGDGDLDLVMTGCTDIYTSSSPETYLYRNNSGSFSFTQVSLPRVCWGNVKWGDFDNDSDLDLVICGQTTAAGNGVQSSNAITRIYRNDGNMVFTDIQAGLPGVAGGYAAWGDYDQDGWLDLAITGEASTGEITQIYQNLGNGTFQELNLGLKGNFMGNLVWGDVSGDGKLDLLVSGYYQTQVFIQTGTNQFALTQTLYGNTPLSLGDANGNGRLDLFLGSSYNNLYSNSLSAGPAPSTPTDPKSIAIGYSVLLGWDDPRVATSEGMPNTYNLYMGTTSGGIQKANPDAVVTTGTRNKVGMGNAGTGKFYQFDNLTPGTYYWGVQSVNPAFKGSAFSTETSFQIPGASDKVMIRNLGSDQLCNGASTTLQAITYPDPSSYQWYLNQSPISGAYSAEYVASQTGSYFVKAYANGKYTTSDPYIISAEPTLGPPAVSSVSVCQGQFGTFSATPGTNGNTCKWYTESGTYLATGTTYTPNPAPLATTRYHVYTYSSSTGCASSGYISATFTVNPLPQTPTGQSQSACSAQSFTLTANNPTAGAVTNWYDAPQGGNLLAVGNTFTTPVLTSSTLYYVAGENSATHCVSTTRGTVTASILASPDLPTTTDAERCGPGTVVLYASPGYGGNTCRWYTTPTGGTPFFTGLSYTLTDLSESKHYFVSSFNTNYLCESEGRTPVSATVDMDLHTPITWDQTRYGISVVNLEAWPGAGGTTCKWYTGANKTGYIATGNYYTTPALSQSTTYYVSTYNAELGCESSEAVPVQVTILPVPTVTLNPDQVFPIPANRGNETYKHVNLFTGDLNLSIPLVEIKGPYVDYSLQAFYNSRSADMSPLFTANPLGGMGWKLMDYPKIVEDGTTAQFYLLDGMQAYLLDTVGQTNTTYTFHAGGDYHLWTITMENIQSSLSGRRWKVMSEDGTVYQFQGVPTSHLDNYKPGYRWDLSAIVDAQQRDSILFSYANGQLNAITSSDHSQWTFGYDNYYRISAITHNRQDINGAHGQLVDKVVLNYDGTFPGQSRKLLSALHFQENTAVGTNTPNLQESIAPILFTYNAANTTNFPGALNTLQVSQGGSIEYAYASFPYNGTTYHPVVGTNSFSGTTFAVNGQTQHQFSPATLKYGVPKVSGDDIYLHHNQCEVIPGGNQLYEAIGDQSTSFETGTRDPVFKDLDPDYIVSTYALSGQKSYFFDGVVEDNTIHSKKFPLNQQEFAMVSQLGARHNSVSFSGSEDSVRVAFYAFDTHDHLDIEFLWTINFYDAQNNKISHGSAGGSRNIDSENYGNWVPVEIVQAIPANAASFDFKIVGGRSLNHYDFYMDDLTVSGSHNTLNGKIVYHFFNGKHATSLRHLPGDYTTPYPDEQVTNLYETGFESGEGYADWLNTSHSSDCKPSATANNADRAIANNGSYAMRLQACGSANSKIYPKNELNIPSGTDRVLLAFTYSSPEFAGMKFKVEGNVGRATWDSTITATGSYFTDPQFTYFYKWFSVNSTTDDFGFTIRATDGGDDIEMNEFFVDDLRIVFLDLDKGTALPAPTVQSPDLLGTVYHAATYTQDNQELEAGEYFFIPGTDATADNRPLQQLYRSLNVQQGVAEQYLSYGYYPDGRLKSTRTTQDMQVPGGTYQQVWYNETLTYADSLYPELGRNDLHILNALKATTKSYSNDKGNSWNLIGANVAMWKTLQPPANAAGKTLAPIWTNYANYIPRTQMSLSHVDAVIAGTATQHPPSSQWIRSDHTLALDAFGQVMETGSADSLIGWSLVNATQYIDPNGITWVRNPVTVAQFGDATPQNSFYWGFEEYENKPATTSYSRSTLYSFLGGQCAQGNLAFSIPFSKASIPGDQYWVTFKYLSPNSGSGVQLSLSGTGLSSQTNFYPPSGKNKQWQTAQVVVTIPDGLTTLYVSLSYLGTATLFMDEFRIMPAPSTFSATIYDIKDYEPVGILDNNGAELRVLRDRFGESNGTIGPDKVPHSFQTAYQPKTNGVYDPLHPNESYNITVRDGGHYFAFNDYEDRSGWQNSYSSPNYENGYITCNNSSTMAIPTQYNPTVQDNFGVAGQMQYTLNSGSIAEAGFSAGNYKFLARMQMTGNSVQAQLYLVVNGVKNSIGTVPIANATASYVVDYLVVFQQNHIHVWFNGQYITNAINFNPANSTRISLIYTQISGQSQIAFSNFAVFNSPKIQAVFTDGLENVLQTQDVNGNDLIVQETLYDLMYREVLQTKQVSLSNTYPGFVSGLVTSFDWESGEMLGSVQNAKQYVMNGEADQKYMYWRSEYAGSPQNQRSMLFNPGYDFAKRAQTNLEKAEKWAYEHEEQIFEAIKYSLDVVQIIIDPESAPFVIAADVGGIIQKHFSHSTDNTEHEQAITINYFDPYQRQTQVSLPWANASKKPKENHILTYSYEFNGNMTLRSTPESGTTRYASDDLGRVRFSQDSAQAEIGTIQYYKYDRWSRPIETGAITAVWNQANLEALAENTTYPTTGIRLEAQWKYDGTEGSNAYLAPSRGKKTQSISYANNAVSSTFNDAFDVNGKLVAHTQIMAGDISAGTYTTHYQYDSEGNVKLIQYPIWNGTPFQVRYQYDYLGNLSQLGDSTAANRYATYQWNPDGSLYHEQLTQTNNRVLPAWHWYNAPGWEDFNGYGDTVRTIGVSFNPWTIIWPEFSYTFSLYSLDLDYNLLIDWWSNLWGQKYYNGDIASSTYTPGPNNPTDELDQGYLYNEYGNLESYYSNYAYDHYWDSDILNRSLRDTLSFDLNNNFVERNYGRDLGLAQHSGVRYKYNISNNHNRATYMAYKEYSNQEWFNHYRYDTLYMDYSGRGNMKLLHWIHRNATSTKGESGSVAFQYWKRMTDDEFGRLDQITYRSTNSDSIWSAFRYDTDGLRTQKLTKTYRGSTQLHTRNTTYFRNANGDPMMEIITGGSRDTVKYYVYGPDGITVMSLNDHYSTKSWFVLKDNLGSAKQLIDRSDLSVDEYYATDEYGAILVDDTRSTGLFNYIYTGQEYDRETGFHYFRARMYDPFCKSFLSPDPEGSNPATPYAFVGNNPVNATDPSGAILFEEVADATSAEIVAAEQEFQGVSTNVIVGQIDKSKTRTRSGMIEFQRRFNNPTTYKTDFDKIFKNRSYRNRCANILRPGDNHEMLPVSTWRDLQGVNIKLEDIQTFSMPTRDTYFQSIDPEFSKPSKRKWLVNKIGHEGGHLNTSIFKKKQRFFRDKYKYNSSSIGAKRAHNELIGVIRNAIQNGGSRSDVLVSVKRWMMGDLGPIYLTRVHDSNVADWRILLKQIK